MSTQRTPKIPGPDHPISLESTAGRVVVRLGDRAIAQTSDAIAMREMDYPVVQYVPRRDVDMSRLERTTHSSYWPYKGEASYYSIRDGGKRSENAVWSYENPYSAVAEIKEYLAFYPDRVDAIEVEGWNPSRGRVVVHRMIDIVASSGLFDQAAEKQLMQDVYAAFLAAIDATDDENVRSITGVALHVLPAERVMMGGRVASHVRIDVVVPAIALASFRRRRRFIKEATAAVVEAAKDASIEERVIVRIVHAVDGGFGAGGHAFTNDEIDEGPELAVAP